MSNLKLNKRLNFIVLVTVVVSLTVLAAIRYWLVLELPPVLRSRAMVAVKEARKKIVVPSYFQAARGEPDVILHGLTLSEVSETRFSHPLRAIDITWYPLLYDSRRDGYVVMAWYKEVDGGLQDVKIGARSVQLLEWPIGGVLMNSLAINGKMRKLPTIESRDAITAPVVGEFLEEGPLYGVTLVGKPMDLMCVSSPDTEHVYGWTSYGSAIEAKGSSVAIANKP